jgi:hypothetical protein
MKNVIRISLSYGMNPILFEPFLASNINEKAKTLKCNKGYLICYYLMEYTVPTKSMKGDKDPTVIDTFNIVVGDKVRKYYV